MGKIISTTFHRDVVTKIQSSDIPLHSLATELQDLKKGEKRTIHLAAAEAYGLYDPAKIILFPRNKLNKDIRVGDTVAVVTKNNHVYSYKVLQLHHHWVNLDGNHPLAGQDLTFEIEGLDSRTASIDDLAEDMNPFMSLVFH